MGGLAVSAFGYIAVAVQRGQRAHLVVAEVGRGDELVQPSKELVIDTLDRLVVATRVVDLARRLRGREGGTALSAHHCGGAKGDELKVETHLAVVLCG